MKGAWIALAMILACGAWADSQPPVPTATKEKSRPPQKDAQNQGHAANKDQRGTEDRPLFVKAIGVPGVEVQGGPKAEQKPDEAANKENSSPTLYRGHPADAWAAGFTGLLVLIGFVTGGILIWQSVLLRRQVKLAREEFSTTSRAFVFLEDIEPTISVYTDNPANSDPAKSEIEIPQRHKDLFVTYFAWQPKWKNAGNTPTRNMRIRVAQQFFENGGMPPEFDFVAMLPSERNFFLGPHAIAGGEVITTNSHFANMVINDGLGSDALILVFGRADYEDIFGDTHFVEWCYKVRLWRPAVENRLGRLRATFIQYGPYNRTDHGTQEHPNMEKPP